jgi:hypothetical protein
MAVAEPDILILSYEPSKVDLLWGLVKLNL